MAFHEERHRDVSVLMRIRFAEAAGHFADGSQYLVHVDGLPTYEAGSEDFRTWFPKAIHRGVKLFRDVAERREGSGVWRLWEEVSALYPSFAFGHSHGLGVLYVGTDPVPELMRVLAGLGDLVILRRAMAAAGTALARTRVEASSRASRAEASETRCAALERALAHANHVVAIRPRRGPRPRPPRGL